MSLNWFWNYLLNRKQRVKINDVVGQESTIDFSVLQSSVLGSILFILYINLVCDLKFDTSIVTYADYTCLIFTNISWERVYNKATVGLEFWQCL